METTINDPVNDQTNADNFKAHALSIVERMNKIPTITAELKNVLFGAFAEIQIMSKTNGGVHLFCILRDIYGYESVVSKNIKRCTNGILVEDAVMNKTFNTGIFTASELYDVLKALRNGMGNFRAYAIKNMQLHSINKSTGKNGENVLLDFRMIDIEQVINMPRMGIVMKSMRRPDFVSDYKSFFNINTALDVYSFCLVVNLKNKGGEQ